ncbi:MAG TPA: DUF418 domain-containing protein [Actinophytocola sp.]|uniref:DUF418 domain-containing protein n=1 Tax=Actinophytocola sp. TaxID=1872138 RepID=UPI002DBA4187|nr:DUF418 domain-containing protein [Actinophytocola sp.]HEU5470931.1 DUF418 domain-containing protein [Actinophytocola sp.]
MTALTKEAGGAAPTTRRISALDALRGFALCGIIFINIPQTMGMMTDLSRAPDGVRLFVLGRFYPIFYLLFGLGFGLFLRSAARRTDRPRVPLVRRLVALGVVGALHHLLQPGEVLLPFAITGLVVLLPLSYAPARVNLWVGAALTVLGVLLGVGGFGVLPGLFVLGFALAQNEFAEKLDRLTGALWVFLVACAVLAVGCYLIIVGFGAGELVGRRLGLVFSMSMAGAYAAAFLLLLRGPVGPALDAVFAPMGRLALTNYLTATVLFVTLGSALGLRGSAEWGTAALLGVGILAVQAVWSPVWLRRFGYGPLEWAWRTVTYRRRIPLRREASTR